MQWRIFEMGTNFILVIVCLSSSCSLQKNELVPSQLHRPPQWFDVGIPNDSGEGVEYIIFICVGGGWGVGHSYVNLTHVHIFCPNNFCHLFILEDHHHWTRMAKELVRTLPSLLTVQFYAWREISDIKLINLDQTNFFHCYFLLLLVKLTINLICNLNYQ